MADARPWQPEAERAQGPELDAVTLTGMEIELLWWEGCPSTERALDELRAALRDVGLPDAEIHMREIRTEAGAEETEFRGSPTILINGTDVLGGGEEPIGLSCRIYRRRDGRISPTPDPDDLREALRRAAPRAEVT
jgi:glutaredoxin